MGPKDRPALIPDGERAKTLQTVARLYDACVRQRLDRSAAIVAFGGGVVGDVAGFAAATYLRGIRLVQVPTTLLAQVDSSVGGKVGVNLPSGKNLVGAFHSPSLVVCDPEVLSTLARREFRSGLYEVVKYGVIASRPLFDRVATGLHGNFQPRHRRPHAARHRLLSDQGKGRGGRRARLWTPSRPQLRAHGRPCARVGDRVPAVPPRRGHRLRHAGGGSYLRGSRAAVRRRGRTASNADSAYGAAPAGRGPEGLRRTRR